MSRANQTYIEELDAEWVQLIMTARELGLSTEDIRSFLKNAAPGLKWEFEVSN